jgi:peroxiredoxin Q/BCP
MRAIALTLALVVATASGGAAQTQQASQTPAPAQPPAQTVPAVGDLAPDFTAPAAGKDGIASQPITLGKLRGKVVVLAFYPADRTSGCTAEMTKFTKEYATLFGDGVVVLPISKDNLESHASWAKDMGMPFVLVSDTAQAVAKAYGSLGSRPGAGFARNVFVIGKDGRIAHSIIRLNALSEEAYAALGQAVASAKQ